MAILGCLTAATSLSVSGNVATAAAPGSAVSSGEALRPLDVTMRGGTVTLMAPADATAKASFGSIDVKAGRAFQLELSSGTGSVARMKQELEKNTLNVLKRYVLDESPIGIIYQSAVADVPEHHVYVVVPEPLGGIVCQDTKGPVYSEAQARAMYAACTSLAQKP